MAAVRRIVAAPIRLGLLAALLLAAGPVRAGGLPTIDITNISDIAFASWGIGDPDATAHIDICVYAALTVPLGSYGITAASAGGFVLKNLNNSTLQLPYSLAWDDGGVGNLGATAGSALTAGNELTNQVNANSTVQTCTGPTARLNIKIAATDLTAALAGSYSGALTLTISPN